MTDNAAADRWALTLYINGASTSSIRAVETVRRVCDEALSDRFDLEIIDVRQQPALVVRNRIVATPTLVRHLPGPPRRIVGNLCRAAWLRLGLDLGLAGVSRGVSSEGPDLSE